VLKTPSQQTISDRPSPQIDTPNHSDDFGSNQVLQQQLSEGKQVASDTPLLDVAEQLGPLPSPQRLDPALDGKFEVIADEAQPTRENQVTATELDELNKLCADIRKGRRTLGVSSFDSRQRADFMDQTLQELGYILQTKVGRQLVTNLADQGPFGPSTEIGISTDPSCNPRNGDPSVSYDPTRLVSEPNESDDAWSKMRSDVTLFHELTHAYHVVNGTYAEGFATEEDGVSPQDVGISLEEIATVGLGNRADDEVTENAYRAARKKLAGGKGEREGDATMVRRDSYARTPDPD
jgi:hypothetical protein